MAEMLTFENTPNGESMLRLMCELLTKQCGGEYEYTYKLIAEDAGDE